MAYISLETGKRALMAQRMGLDVTSNNIANVNTPGYSRRTPNMEETDPYKHLGVNIGTGVMVETMRNYREEFFDREIRNTKSRQSAYESDQRFIERIEAILAEPSDLGLGEMVGEFFNNFEDMASNPEDVSLREYAIDVGRSLAERFNGISSQYTELRAELRSSVASEIGSINNKLEQVAKLNVSAVQAASGKNNQDAQTFVDKREALLEELSETLDITVAHEKNGSVNVFNNGINLVTGANHSKIGLEETIDPNTSERTLHLVKLSNKGNVVNILRPRSGELASDLKHYNITLDDKDSSGEFSAFKRLDEFAGAIVSNVNQITTGGYGLDDTSAPPAGRSFFEPAVGQATAADSGKEAPAERVAAQEGEWREKKPEEKLHLLMIFFVGSISVHVFVTGLSVVSALVNQNIVQRMTHRLRRSVLEKLGEMDMAMFSREQVGQLMTRTMDDTAGIPGNLTHLVVNVITQIGMLVLGAVILLRLNPRMTMVTLGALPFYGLV
ncbi:MAG: flagellar hook-associated protein FlgK, partial [Candidatus Kapaibacterium sp.]